MLCRVGGVGTWDDEPYDCTRIVFNNLKFTLKHLKRLITLAWCFYSCCLVLFVGRYLYRCTVHFVV